MCLLVLIFVLTFTVFAIALMEPACSDLLSRNDVIAIRRGANEELKFAFNQVASGNFSGECCEWLYGLYNDSMGGEILSWIQPITWRTFGPWCTAQENRELLLTENGCPTCFNIPPIAPSCIEVMEAPDWGFLSSSAGYRLLFTEKNVKTWSEECCSWLLRDFASMNYDEFNAWMDPIKEAPVRYCSDTIFFFQTSDKAPCTNCIPTDPVGSNSLPIQWIILAAVLGGCCCFVVLSCCAYKLLTRGLHTFSCKHCGKVYDQKAVLKNHVRLRHTKTKQKQAEDTKCPFCDRLCQHLAHLKTHVKMRHESKFSKWEKVQFAKMNGKVAEADAQWLLRQAESDGGDLFLCEFCKKKCAHWDHLSTHVKMRHDRHHDLWIRNNPKGGNVIDFVDSNATEHSEAAEKSPVLKAGVSVNTVDDECKAGAQLMEDANSQEEEAKSLARGNDGGETEGVMDENAESSQVGEVPADNVKEVDGVCNVEMTNKEICQGNAKTGTDVAGLGGGGFFTSELSEGVVSEISKRSQSSGEPIDSQEDTIVIGSTASKHHHLETRSIQIEDTPDTFQKANHRSEFRPPSPRRRSPRSRSRSRSSSVHKRRKNLDSGDSGKLGESSLASKPKSRRHSKSKAGPSASTVQVPEDGDNSDNAGESICSEHSDDWRSEAIVPKGRVSNLIARFQKMSQ